MFRHKPDDLISSRHIRLAAFTIGALVLVLNFATNFDGAFVLDDRVNLTDNPAVTQFDPTSPGSWQAAAFESPARLRPIPYLTFAWQWYLFGGSRAALHFLSDLFHALAAVALFFLLLEFLALHYKPSPPASLPITGRGAPETARKIPSPSLSGSPLLVIGRGVGGEGEREGVLLAATGALLWALHPVQTSAVTYLVQRMAVLSGLFQLLALWLYLRGRRTGEGRNYLLAALSYLCALFSKENAAALPVIVSAYEWLLGPAEEKRIRFRRIGLLLLACVPPILMAAAYGAMEPSQHFATGTMPGRDFTLAERLLSAPRMYFRYLKLLVLPWPQALDYGLAASKGILSPWTTLASWIAGVAVLTLAILKRKSFPITAFLLLGFFLALAPESTFLNLELFFEHRLYLAGAALLPLVPVGMWKLREEWGVPADLTRTAVVLLLVAAASLTGLRNRDWQSEVRLTEGDVKHFPENSRAHYNFGTALSDAGNYENAILSFRRALELDPSASHARLNLGTLLAASGHLDKALPVLRQAVAERPKDADAHYNLGKTLAGLGNKEEAEAELRGALRLDQGYAEAHGELGLLLVSQGKLPQAREEFERAIRAKPDLGVAHYQLGLVLRETGRLRDSMESFDRACSLGIPQACRQIPGRQ